MVTRNLLMDIRKTITPSLERIIRLTSLSAYNRNLNDRFARKDGKFKARKQQLDLVIVVDRLLTGFDAPCLSTLFMDRQPMQPHDIIQAVDSLQYDGWQKA